MSHEYATHDRAATCPFCGKLQDKVTSATPGHKEAPTAGDLTICIVCGEFAIFADDSGETLRAPTDAEYDQIASDPVARKMRIVWTDLQNDLKEKAARLADKAAVSPGGDEPSRKSFFQDEWNDNLDTFKKSYPEVVALFPDLITAMETVYYLGAIRTMELITEIRNMPEEQGRKHMRAIQAELMTYALRRVVE